MYGGFKYPKFDPHATIGIINGKTEYPETEKIKENVIVFDLKYQCLANDPNAKISEFDE